ncbi:MAG: hypothetical protein PWP23_45 [Candidatus Sumerlaeota bacterium]|nr:hypothetical protein [Candidatus Sumerlaeota bacterium]
MIVDDEEDVRAILRASLSEHFEVVEAQDGLDALEKLERYEPDFICLDVMMPMMDGFDCCAAIRKSARFSDIPVMFLTALGNKEHIMKGYGSGANLYLTKPFDPDRLIRNIEVHFTSTKSSPKVKRLTLDQIRALEDGTVEPEAPGAPVDPEVFEALKPPAAAPASPKPARVPPKPALLPRLMVVDDEVDVTTMVTHALGLQAEVVSAQDGISAIEKLVRYQPDLMMIDIMIPRMSGFQLCQSLRANRAFKNLPILVCSARCSERDKQFALRVGANDFLAKPFTPTELAAKFSSLISAPGFKVRPKAVSLDDIKRTEATDEEEDVFQETTSKEEAEGIDRRTFGGRAKNTQEIVGDFLINQKKKEVQGQQAPEEDKGKRRLFRFGKK